MIAISIHFMISKSFVKFIILRILIFRESADVKHVGNSVSEINSHIGQWILQYQTKL
jgi:hypothetical protein